MSVSNPPVMDPPEPISLRDRAKRLIKWFNAVRDQLFHVRFPLITVAAGSAMVLAIPQVRELFYLLARDDRHWWLAYIMTFWLGLAVWYCGRTIYRFRFKRWPSSHANILPGFKRMAPRVMGAMVPVLMAIGCLHAYLDVRNEDAALSDVLLAASAVFLSEAVLVWFLVVYRRPLLNQFKDWLPDVFVPNTWNKEVLDVARAQEYTHWVRTIFLGGLAANLFLSLMAINYAHEIAFFLGPIATIMLAGIFFTITGSLLTFAGTLARVPLLTLLIAFAAVLHYFHLNDNHYVRQCAEMNSHETPAACGGRSQANSTGELERYWTEWSEGLKEGDPIFLVSAEGGGIRAAAWTAMVLSHLSDLSDGKFDRHVFAASGVSGGSLGIATYASLIKTGRASEDSPLAIRGCTDQGRMLCAADRVLRKDFLAPNLVNLFFVDTLQRFLPARLVEDRGQRLEESWARSFSEEIASAGGSNPLAESFEALYADHGKSHLPLALLNATAVQSGERFVQSPFRLFDENRFRQVFPGARDSHDYLPPSMPLNAAAHNSARFTYVSPAGTVEYENGEETRRMQVVDGGYFENSGTVTLGDIYRWLKLKELPNPIYVIHISNDAAVPSMLRGGLDACPAPTTDPPQCPVIENNELSKKLAGEVSAPVRALLRTRGARGENARQQLAQSVVDDNQVLMHFRLCRGDNQLPLGWALSELAWNEMKRQLGIDGDRQACFVGQHQNQLNSILTALSGSDPLGV